jgi:hypothetical protein
VNAAQLAYAIPGGMVIVGGSWFIGEIVIGGIRTLVMDAKVRHAERLNTRTWTRAHHTAGGHLVEGAAADDCPRAASAPSTPIYDWARDPELAANHDSMTGTAAELALLNFDRARARSQADVDRTFDEIARSEAERAHPSAGGTA